jgi:hypothetical protein
MFVTSLDNIQPKNLQIQVLYCNVTISQWTTSPRLRKELYTVLFCQACTLFVHFNFDSNATFLLFVTLKARGTLRSLYYSHAHYETDVEHFKESHVHPLINKNTDPSGLLGLVGHSICDMTPPGDCLWLTIITNRSPCKKHDHDYH